MTQWARVSALHTASGFSRDGMRAPQEVAVCAVLSLAFPNPGVGWMILTFGDEPLTNTVSRLCLRLFRNHSATSFAWKGRSSRSRSRLSNSVISTAVLGFLILFNARKMCSLRLRLEFGIFFIAGCTVSMN